MLILSRIEGLTYREISTQTGWSAADISRSMATAMKTLARALGDAERR
jgi:DNA-directed RNA polymerase specialized sigma24 family protein